jgi:hypothetical protein
MGWETRAGQRYYYRCLRIGGRPKRICYGKGEAAAAHARLDVERRLRQRAERGALLAEQARVAQADRALRDFGTLVDLIASAVLLLTGHHRHRGCWRRRHDQTRQGRAT